MSRCSFLLVGASILAFCRLPVWANGGGYTRGGVSDTGTIKLFQPTGMQEVGIADEQLEITLGPSSTEVQVRYVLKNSAGRKAHVRFGFPVEELAEERMYEEEGKARRRKQALEYCREYQVLLGDKPIDSRFQAEPAKSGERDARFRGLRGWMVSEITLGPSEEKTMLIRFRADYPYSGTFVSDDGHLSSRNFKYRLSTGASWSGPITHGRVLIRAKGVDPDGVKILQPVNRFRRTGAQWEWTFDQLEPTLSDDLNIQVVPEQSTYSGRAESGKSAHWDEKAVELVKRSGKWYVVHTNYAVTASSTLPPQKEERYDASNVRIWKGVWSEGAPGPGIGEWLELKPEVPRPLRSIIIYPGHHASPLLFQANARPQRVEVTLNGEHRFETTLEDGDEGQPILIQGYDKPVKTIRLTVREVYPGKRYEDLCISGVRLETRALKVPKVEPAR